MRWISLLEAAGFPTDGTRPAAADLSAEYRAGRSVGVVTLGTRHLFFRRLWKVYYIPYGSLSRFFRRVAVVPARIGCCNTGEIRVEHLVLCAVPDGDGEAGDGPSSVRDGADARGGMAAEQEIRDHVIGGAAARGGMRQDETGQGVQPDGERELAQIQLPGERAAVALIEELRRLAPGAACGKPAKQSDANGPAEDTDSPAEDAGKNGEAGA